MEPATVHKGGFVTRGLYSDALAVLYFGQNELLCDLAELAEAEGNHQLAGKLFGYPQCCISAYSDASSRSEKQQDLTAFTVPDLGPFARELNPLLRFLYGYRLIFHFPCSMRCESSLRLARRRVDLLASLTSSARDLEFLGSGLSLYGPQIGAVLAFEFDRISSDTVVAHSIVFREVPGSPFSGIATDPEIHLCSAHSFTIDGRRFEDRAHFAAFFA